MVIGNYNMGRSYTSYKLSIDGMKQTETNTFHIQKGKKKIQQKKTIILFFSHEYLPSIINDFSCDSFKK